MFVILEWAQEGALWGCLASQAPFLGLGCFLGWREFHFVPCGRRVWVLRVEGGVHLVEMLWDFVGLIRRYGNKELSL